jgi:two-component system sensor histidine kinase VicK
MVFSVFHQKQTKGCKTRQLLQNTLNEVNMITAKLTDNYWCKNNFGKLFPLAFTAVSLWEGNNIIGSVILFRDATEEKEIDQAKDEFVSLASHQLRTPLSTINWYAEMLLDQDAGAITPEQKDFLEEIYNANKRMTELVSALLNVSRLDLGTFALDPKPADIVALVKEVLQDLKALTQKNEIRIAEQYEKIPTVNIDKDLMRIVFQNLISNAIKYSPRGGLIAVEIGLSRGKQGRKKHLAICIRDSGYGIPKTAQKKIFTKLFRADNIKTKITDGNGLGLYIVKSIITHSGGTISFTSEENKGTSFFITLPCDGIQSRADKKTILFYEST